MNWKKEFHGLNLGYILELYDRYQADPGSVDQATRQFFDTWGSPSLEPAFQPGVDLEVVASVARLAQAIRARGYLAARLDPLGSPPMAEPSLSLEFHQLSAQDLRRLPAGLLGLADPSREDAYQALEALRGIYSGSIGYDYGHIRIPEERHWLQQAAEGGRFRPPADPVDEIGLLERLSQVEAFENFIHRIYPGKTRFSVEGLDMLVPMLDETVRAAARANICVILIGMAHRGRLNVLAHVLQKPYQQILAEFKDPQGRAATWDALGWTGDVKYHLGGYKSPADQDGIDLVIHMPSNPSHLEHINPVILGMTRAANSAVEDPGPPHLFPQAALPVLIHGDASFSGQGIVAETLNLACLPGYQVSGCLHIIANNQLGFTATDRESRSSLHASDLAKGFEFPIIHVSADDPPACLEAIRTACAYRLEFRKDFVINLIGYRRYGHNEGDEPRFTQPVMYRQIENHPSLRELWAARLEREQIIPADYAERQLHAHMQVLQEVNRSLEAEQALQEPVPQPPPPQAAQKVDTRVPLERLSALNRALLEFPADFQLNPKLKKALQRRRKAFEDPQATRVDWATAEELAFASLLEDGIAIRLTGEDVVRGTFSQRHAAFYDVESGEAFIPLQSLSSARAAFEVHNSPLTEVATLGFEFGYNIQAPDRLVLWEAQYGDFINSAQAMIDEFIAPGRAKWGLTPSLVLLLPHGNEGQGPDHSSGRSERFLSLAAEGNLRVAIPSTAAQYFHLLRRQALLLENDPLPLVVLTPKGLLRHDLVASPLKDLAEGRWQPLLPEENEAHNPEQVKTLILCSGKLYVDLVSSDRRAEYPQTSIARLEQLYPFPEEALQQVLDQYPRLERLTWAQEEPLNMGAWSFLRPRLRATLPEHLSLNVVGRPASSSPAEGSTTMYRHTQAALIRQAFQVETEERTQGVMVERG